MDAFTTWIGDREALVWWLVASSVVMFVGSLILVPWLLVRLPHDYFARRHRDRFARPFSRMPLARLAFRVAKNLLGAVFILAGVTMLVLPGQGLLTILVGVMLLDFPGKYELERWIIGRRSVLNSINWLRRRADRKPLVIALENDPRDP